MWLGNAQSLSRNLSATASVRGDSALQLPCPFSETVLRSVFPFSCRETGCGLSVHALQSGWSRMSGEVPEHECSGELDKASL